MNQRGLAMMLTSMPYTPQYNTRPRPSTTSTTQNSQKQNNPYTHPVALLRILSVLLFAPSTWYITETGATSSWSGNPNASFYDVPLLDLTSDLTADITTSHPTSHTHTHTHTDTHQTHRIHRPTQTHSQTLEPFGKQPFYGHGQSLMFISAYFSY